MRIVNIKHSVVYNNTITSGNLHGRSYKPCLLPMLVAFIIHIPFNFLNDINCSICNVFLHIMSYSTQVCVDMIYKKGLYKFFWGLGGTYPFHCGVLTPYLYTCCGNKRPSKINVVLNKGYTS